MTDNDLYNLIGKIFYHNRILDYADYDIAIKLVAQYILNDYYIPGGFNAQQFEKQFERFWMTTSDE